MTFENYICLILSNLHTYWLQSPLKITKVEQNGKELSFSSEGSAHFINLIDKQRKGKINSVKDLKGKRVSLDEPGSGTYVDALLILEANGLSEKDVKNIADFISSNDLFLISDEIYSENVYENK